MCVARVSFCTLACTPGEDCMGVAVCLFRKACVSLCSWKDTLKECKDVFLLVVCLCEVSVVTSVYG